MATGLLAVAFARAPAIELHDAATGQLCIDMPPMGLGYARGCAFSPDGAHLAVTLDTNPGLVVINLATGETRIPESGLGTVHGCAFSPDSTKLAVASSGSPYLRVLDISTLTPSPATLAGGNPTGIAYACAWSPDGSRLAVAHSTSPYLTVYNTATWAKLAVSGGNPPNGTRCCAWSPDGSRLAVGNVATPPYLTVYETATWAKADISSITLMDSVFGCAFSPSGAQLAVTGTTDKPLRVFAVPSWDEVTIAGTVPGNYVFALDWSADGTAIALSHDGWPYVSEYNTATWAKSTPFATGEKGGSIHCVRYSRAAGLQPRRIGTTAANPVTDEEGEPVAAVVRAYSRASGRLIGSATAGGDGAYSIGPFALQGEAQVVFLDPDAAPLQNDLIHRVLLA